MKRLLSISIITLSLLTPTTAFAWDDTGHELVARIAWEHMTPATRQRVIDLLKQAPSDACLLDLLPQNAPNEATRRRQFFILVATWADIVLPKGANDTRVCKKYGHGAWHSIDYHWSGVSGNTMNPPHDLNIPVAQINGVERLQHFSTSVVSNDPASARALDLAWIIHLVGDIHQPTHTSSRVTNAPGEAQGDHGGATFVLATAQGQGSLLLYWNHIIDESISRQSGEGDWAYLDRVANIITTEYPRSSLSANLEPGQFDSWAHEGLKSTQNSAYPATLHRNQIPSDAYQQQAFTISKRAIALAGYRLANLLNQLFGH